MRGRYSFTVLLSIGVAVAVAHAQGFYVETIRTSGDKAMDKFYYMPKMFKMVGSDGRISIFRIDKETVYMVNPAKKSYSGMTFAELKEMMEKSRNRIGDLVGNRLAQLPPDQRKKLEEKMAALKNQSATSPVNYQVAATGESKPISGYQCQKYVVTRNGKEFETVWATKQISGFESVKKDMQDLTDRMSSAIGTRAPIHMWLKDIDGFPIQTESHGNVSVATKVERKAIPASEFEIPGGYTKEKSPVEEALGSGH